MISDASTLHTNVSQVWDDVATRQATRDPFFDRLARKRREGQLPAAHKIDHIALDLYELAPVIIAYFGERHVANAAFKADMETIAPSLCAHLNGFL